MKTILLSDGSEAIVDDEDYEELKKYRWHNVKGYAVTTPKYGYGRNGTKTKTIQMHRIVNKTPEGLVTDHKNHNKLDNRKENLRSVTQAENVQNSEGFVFTEGINAKRNRTHCRHGHDMEEVGYYLYKDNRKRCVQCHKDRMKRLYLKKKHGTVSVNK